MAPEKHLNARIVDRQDVADDLFILRLEASGQFTYLAGQYATIGVELDGKRLERAYSLCSSPYQDALEFFVERVPGGELSPLLHAMDKGAPLLLRRFAKGRFTLDLKSGRRKHLLLATVTGVAPSGRHMLTPVMRLRFPFQAREMSLFTVRSANILLVLRNAARCLAKQDSSAWFVKLIWMKGWTLVSCSMKALLNSRGFIPAFSKHSASSTNTSSKSRCASSPFASGGN
jgi:predicted ferric reductase